MPASNALSFPFVSATVKQAVTGEFDASTRIGRLMAKIQPIAGEAQGDIYETGDVISEQWGAIRRARVAEKPDYQSLVNAYQVCAGHPDFGADHPATGQVLGAAAATFLNLSGVNESVMMGVKGAAAQLLVARESRGQNLKTATLGLQAPDSATKFLSLVILEAIGGHESFAVVAAFTRGFAEDQYGTLDNQKAAELVAGLGVMLKMATANGDAAMRDEVKGKLARLFLEKFSIESMMTEMGQAVVELLKTFGEDVTQAVFTEKLEKGGFFTEKKLFWDDPGVKCRNLFHFIKKQLGNEYLTGLTLRLLASPADPARKKVFCAEMRSSVLSREVGGVASAKFEPQREELKRIVAAVFATPASVADLVIGDNDHAQEWLQILQAFAPVEIGAIKGAHAESVKAAYANLTDWDREFIVKNRNDKYACRGKYALLAFFGVVPNE